MRDSSNLHQKVQDMCDCYTNNDPLKEMSKLQADEGAQDGAVRWLSLAVLHGLGSNAEEISIEKTRGGKVRVIAEYRRAELPAPDAELSDAILKLVKDILHVDSSQGDSTLAFGFRNNSFDLKVKTREEGADHKVTLRFP